MSLVTRPTMNDDTGTFDNGTVVNAAFGATAFDQIDDQCHSTTNTTVKPKAITDEVVTARGTKASLAARLLVSMGTDGTLTGVVKRLTTDVTAGASVGAGETTLVQYSVPANTLPTDGQVLRFTVYGATANNANAKTLKAYFGSTAFYNSPLAVNSAGLWVIRGEIVRTGQATQIARAQVNHTDTAPTAPVGGAAPGESLSGAVILKITGTGTSNGDITEALLIVEVML